MRLLIMGSPTSKALESFGNSGKVNGGGWIENLIINLSKKENLEIYVCFYYDSINIPTKKYFENIYYIALPIRVKGLQNCNNEMIEDLKWAYEESSPDIVHIIGTEREHNLKLLEIANPKRTIISITGMVTYCSIHYYGGIEEKNFKNLSLGDILRHGGPIREKRLFERFSISEKQLIRNAKYVTGRTTWDYACVKQLNPNIKYTYCSEILNDVFYRNSWNLNKIERYRIFVSQGSYPLKGLHKLFEALPTILKYYPDTEVYIAGPNILDDSTLMKKIKRTTYAKYLKKLITELKLPFSKIHFTGPLDYNGMLEQYLKANVFVLPSIIENSPNSLGEAMNLGMPCVSSCVGGIQDMLRDKVDGFLYPYDESYMLSYYVCKIFGDDELAEQIGKNARESAIERFDINRTINIIYDLYNRVLKDVNNDK